MNEHMSETAKCEYKFSSLKLPSIKLSCLLIPQTRFTKDDIVHHETLTSQSPTVIILHAPFYF